VIQYVIVLCCVYVWCKGNGGYSKTDEEVGNYWWVSLEYSMSKGYRKCVSPIKEYVITTSL
jgi:hypothetical protein